MIQLSPANTFQIRNYFSSDYFALGKFEKSLQILNQLITENPYDYDLLVNRANIYMAMKNFDAAKKDCDVLINKDNSSYKYYQLRAQVYLKLGNKALALADYKKALELINKEYDINKEDITILFDRAEQNKILGNDLDAMADYDKVLLLFPGNYKALAEKVRFVLLQKDWARAIGYYDQLMHNYPPEEEFYNNQAIAYLNLGDYDNALVKFNKTIELNQQNCDALYNRSKLYRMMGNEERSKDDLKRIILILNERKRNGKISNNDLEWLNRLKMEILS
jgi:tetratricopeptide (TPR) repeat protein